MGRDDTMDEFEKTMDGEIEEPTGDDETEDTAEDKTAEKVTPQSGDTKADEGEDDVVPVTVESLQEQIKGLEESIGSLGKVNKGQYKDLKAERANRQQLEGKVNAVTELIAKIKSRSREGSGDDEGDEGDGVQVGKKWIPVLFDDDGNPRIDPDDLKSLTAKEVESIKKDLSSDVAQVKQTQAAQGIQNTNTRAVESVLTKDEAYSGAYKQLTEAFRMLDEGITGIVDRQGVDAERLNMDQALGMMEADPVLMKNFKVRFPTIDMDTVIDAMALSPTGRVNTRRLTRALNALKSVPGETVKSGKGGKEGEGGISKTLRAITKARNLAGATNQKGSRETSLDDIAALDIDDFLGMSNAEVAEIEKTLLNEELAGA